MKNLCQQGGVLDPNLSQAIDSVVQRCIKCTTIGRPLHIRKLSLNKPLKTFNEEVLLDYVYIFELTKYWILHIKDRATELVNSVAFPNRGMENAGRIFETYWIPVNDAPTSVSFDQEFNNNDFLVMLKRYGTQSKLTPAIKHKKIG